MPSDLPARVALAMGWTLDEHPHAPYWARPDGSLWGQVAEWNPDTDDRDAGVVLDWLEAQTPRPGISLCTWLGGWNVRIEGPNGLKLAECSAPTRREAICRALLAFAERTKGGA